MKKIYLLFSLLLAGIITVNAQVANYAFEAQTGVALENTAAATVLINAGEDETASSAVAIPFSFVFNGQSYNQFSVSTNGYLGLGATPVQQFISDEYLTISATYPIIVGWGDDLNTTTNGNVSYQITGVAPNRKVVVEWKVKKTTDRGAGINKTFQVWLFERSNKVQFVYGVGFANDFNGGSIGIASSSEDYISVDALEDAASSSFATVNWGAWPGTGKSYVFTPAGSAQLDPIVVAENAVVTNVTCNGQSNGSIKLGTISGGDGNYTITWTLPNGTTATGNELNAIAAGIYNYSVTDGAESTAVSGAIEVLEPQALTLAATATNATCNGEANGTITVNSNGTYIIKDAEGNDVTAETEFAAGTYTIVAVTKNEAGEVVCSSNPVTVVITEPSAIEAQISMTPATTVAGQKENTIYLGYGPQSVKLSVTNVKGGAAATGYTYSWYPTTGLSNASIANPTAAPTVTITYAVTITDNSGCSITKTITVNVVDVRCGDKVSVCKNGKQECVKVKDVQELLERGGVLGTCEVTTPQPPVNSAPSISVYPNPTTGKFTVAFSKYTANKVMVLIINQFGRTVSLQFPSISSKSNTVSYNLSNQPQGLYYISVISENGIQTSKVLIKR